MGKVEQHNEGVPEISPQTEASKLLEAALLQMDGIISGNISTATSNSPDYGFVSPPLSPPGVKDAANFLVSALQSNSNPPPPDPVVARTLMTWIQGSDHDDKLRKLQSEKDNLQLQVQVLTEQIEAQGDKITDLEKVLIERKQQLTNSEDMLQREMLSRSSLETQKLELMSAISEMKLHQAALERENLELRSSRFNNNGISGTKPPVRARPSPQPHHSTPVHHNSNPGINVRMSPSPSPVPTGAMISQSPRKIESNSPVQDLAQPPKTPPANYRRQIDIHYGSLPRQQFISNGEIVPVTDTNANTANNSRKGVAFGRGFYSLLGVRGRGHSVPNLAETEKIIIDENSDGTPSSPSLQFNKNKGIKKIFGRMRRSGSGNLEDIPGLSEFQRGGVRATAAARLGWSEPLILTKPDKPFPEWDTENICDWLQDLGLEQYISEAKRWIKNGQQLQEVPIQEIEKELGIRNVLHRKKLQLAIADSLENGSSDPYLEKAGKLDTAWVLRWLDDSGLPQHKEAFLINRIDGRVLHRLTVDDLSVLHVTSLLHVASLKRGIQVLRENDFEPGCLQRRSLPDDPEQPTPKQICLWTTHRVMEWLRAVDLAEYAPNLRGAGVHGGLMVLEDKFTSELLATLLNIPPGKTLLRRHLNTHFKELLGKDIIQEKRESEGTLGYIPLTPSAKLKVTKKSQFSLKRKKSKGEVDYGDLVCPLNPNCEGEMNGSIRSSMGIKRVEEVKEEAVSLLSDDGSLTDSFSQSPCVSPLPDRHLV
uniref:SAM domain-containing protein n=1 Tax=Photinus pyralis TaxID=7054 RepID=A0A1Y1LCX5_PHOPY